LLQIKIGYLVYFWPARRDVLIVDGKCEKLVSSFCIV